MRPVVATQITQHTLWQALVGELPPLTLPPRPIAHAALDSRDIGDGDLFIALPGQHTDGHDFIGNAIERGAQAVICEERGRELAAQAGARVVNCTRERWGIEGDLPATAAASSLAYIVNNCVAALQKVGGFQRLHRSHPQLRVIGVTGSVGKTTTKEVVAAVLSQRFKTLHSQGNLNNEQGLPLTLLGLGSEHERAVLEMGMYALGEIYSLCTLARPHVGVITNVGPIHLSRLGAIERIAQAKAELVQALPDADSGGVAILNWDEELVQAMADLTSARIFRYGTTPEADLWADEIESAGMEGIRFRFHYREAEMGKEDTLHVRVPLLGRHSVHTALRAAAVGLVEELSWEEIVSGLQNMPGQLRLVVAPGINHSTIIDDTYNASPASTVAALNLLDDLGPTVVGRRVAVLGDMLELGHYTDEGHKIVGRRAADVVDVLITVGELGRSIGEHALEVDFDVQNLHIMADAEQTIALLKEKIQPGDLVLVKGSRAVGMDIIVGEIILDETIPGTPRPHRSKEE